MISVNSSPRIPGLVITSATDLDVRTDVPAARARKTAGSISIRPSESISTASISLGSRPDFFDIDRVEVLRPQAPSGATARAAPSRSKPRDGDAWHWGGDPCLAKGRCRGPRLRQGPIVEIRSPSAERGLPQATASPPAYGRKVNDKDLAAFRAKLCSTRPRSSRSSWPATTSRSPTRASCPAQAL